MLDATMIVGGNNISFNAVSGTLIKSTKNSKIIRFHTNSRLAGYMFCETNPRRSEDTYGNKYCPISVLQVMLCSGEQLLVEYIDLEKDS